MTQIDKSWAEDFFRLARRAFTPQTVSTTDTLLEVVSAAELAIRQHSFTGTLTALQSLRQCLEMLRLQLDEPDRGKAAYEAAIEYMTMRKQNLELQFTVAQLTGAEQAAADIQRAIDEMAPFFDAAISDLDPSQQ
jgi:polygalacturonase